MNMNVSEYENHMMEKYKRDYVITKDRGGMTSIQGKRATITPYDTSCKKYQITLYIDNSTLAGRKKYFKLLKYLERKFNILNIPVNWVEDGVGVFNSEYVHAVCPLIGARTKTRKLNKEWMTLKQEALNYVGTN